MLTEGTRAAYVALGDSISIDEYAGGPGRGGASLLFRNRDVDFPDWQGRDLSTERPGSTFSLLAMDGGTTRTLLDVQLPRLESLRIRPDLVTITIGGNDLLAAYGNTQVARSVITHVGAALSRGLSRLEPLLAPGAAVIVGTVYDPSDGTADAQSLGLPPWPDAVEVIAELNATLRRVAGNAGAAVAEIAGLFHGHGIRAGAAWRPDARPAQRDLWLCSIIEPNAWGAGGVREAFWAALHR